MTLNGRCLCGMIEFSLHIEQVPKSVVCNCDSCRIATSCCSNNLPVSKRSVEVTKGSPKAYGDNATDSGYVMHRYFCGDCGTPLFSIPTNKDMSDIAFVKVGCLEQAKDIQAGSVLYFQKIQNGIANINNLASA